MFMKKYLGVFLLSVILCFFAVGVSAYSVIGIYDADIYSGSSGDVPVYISGVEDAEGLSFSLIYDVNLLKVDDVKANSSILGSDVYYNVDDVMGSVKVAVTNDNGITVGEYDLVSVVDVTFSSIGMSGEADVEFYNASYSNNFMPYSFDQIDNGKITLGGDLPVHSIYIGDTAVSIDYLIKQPVDAQQLVNELISRQGLSMDELWYWIEGDSVKNIADDHLATNEDIGLILNTLTTVVDEDGNEHPFA